MDKQPSQNSSQEPSQEPQRRTKIVATLGPATDSGTVLESLILAGVNLVRLNFSHGDPSDHKKRADKVRALASQHNRSVAILGDLQGPKIRIGRFKDGAVDLKANAEFVLDAGLSGDTGDSNSVGLDYQALPEDCNPGDVLLLDDGRITLEVTGIDQQRIFCRVVNGGRLSNNKGINRQGGGLSAPALTEKDRADIQSAADIGVDYLAVSFPRSGEDICLARKLMEQAGGHAALVAKIERAEVTDNSQTLSDVILASDAVMVARGDLGVEIGDAELVGVQKQIIHQARIFNRPVITATQMMESMITSSLPTRAEVFDVANAVLDGTDAVMLSAETATGDHPENVVAAMARICLGAEKQPAAQLSTHRLDCSFDRTDEAVAMATMYTANHMGAIKAIVCLTESGNTPLWMSRINSALPIYALTRSEETRRKVALYRGVEAFLFDPTGFKTGAAVNEAAAQLLCQAGFLQKGDSILLTKGDTLAVVGETNTLKILKV
ncbi:pyruvate kinase [Parendozoicomonas haliclonae]|uniref:Pyruvate kinase n=1 Tax=Parendozoicomonas haliclonae TaxID=1960125 RepID=A0A1X7AIU6_9GAMM|nr:pyruvate kinase [Parendozoicomonas haliclonae]SMA43927.1 Pyruvate kinase II [Parendozoicomonas haliclonae]